MQEDKIVEIKIPSEMLKQIQKFVEQKRFKSVDDFVEQAAKLLIYAEERKDDFRKILQK